MSLNSMAHPGLLNALPRRRPRVPGTRAIVSADGELSYEMMWQQILTTGSALERLGVRSGDRVALFFARSADYVISLMAVFSVGAVAVPMDPDYPPRRLAQMIATSQPSLVLHGGGVAESTDVIRRHRCIDINDLRSYRTVRDQYAGRQRVCTADPAIVLFTSGSTGEPKGVVLTHRGIVNRLRWADKYYEFDGSDRVLHKASVAFDASLHEIFAPLIAGGTLVIAPPGLQFDSRGLVRLIEDEGVTTAHFVPSMLRLVLEEPDLAYVDLRRVFCGGEALDMDIVRRFRDLLPSCKLYNQYGPTETSLSVTYWDASEPFGGTIAPIGRPISNVKLSIVKEDLSGAEVGEAGELWIGGVAVGCGYLNDDAATRERFREDPLRKGPGQFYRSGDIVRRNSAGYLEFLGRSDDQVKIRGVRVEPEEIGAVLRAHPTVKDAFVVAAQNSRCELRLAGYVVWGDGLSPEPSAWIKEIRSYLAGVLPRAMHPDDFVFVPRLPRLPNGKVSRLALPGLPASPGGAGNDGRLDDGDIAGVLRQIWRAELGVDAVGDDDDFVTLGGHSLVATRISAAAGALGVEISPDSCMRAPSFGEWLRTASSLATGDAR